MAFRFDEGHMRDPFERVHKQAAQSLQPALCAIASALRGGAPPASYDDTHREHLADELREWVNGPFGLQLAGTALTPPDERAAALCSTDASSSDDDWSDVDLAEMTLERYATLPLHTPRDGLGLSGQACTLFSPPSPTSSDEVILAHEPYEEYFAVHAPGDGPDEEDAAAMEEEEMRRYRAFGVPPLTPRLALLVVGVEKAAYWQERKGQMAPPTFSNTPHQTIDISALPDTRFLDTKKRKLPYRDEHGHVNTSLLALAAADQTAPDGLREKLRKWQKHADAWLATNNPEPWARDQNDPSLWLTASGLRRREPTQKPAASAKKPAAPKRPAPSSAAAASSAALDAKKRVVSSGVTQVRSQAPRPSTKSTHVAMVIKSGYRAPVDPSCRMAELCHVYEHSDDIYDALLNQTNIAQNNNKYYMIQLLETDSTPHQYYCWNRWGRVGEERNYQNALRGPMALEQAKKDFCQKFKDKTKNDWSARTTFETQPGKYTLLARDYGAAASEEAAAPDAEAQPPPPCMLDERVQGLLELVTDARHIEQSIREIGFDSEQMPLGKLQKTTLSKAYALLKRLDDIVIGTGGNKGGASDDDGDDAARSSGGGGGGSGGSVRRSAASSGSSGGVRKSRSQEILDLSNAYYSLIPHISRSASGHARAKLPLIDTRRLLLHEVAILDALSNVELASRVLGGASRDGPAVHPLDAKYAELRTTLTPVAAGSEVYALLQRMVAETHAPTHDTYSLELLGAFEVERHGEAAAFRDVGNRKLLWHGSRITNWAGIMSGGLRIAPPEAPVTGYMFGKGLYFADMVSKSTNYCFASRDAPVGVAVLCDVALGEQYERLKAEYEAPAKAKKQGKHSTWGRGKTVPDPKAERAFPGDSGLKVPLGPSTEVKSLNSALLYNEYIVYDPRQVQQKFVLQLKFHFKQR